MKGKIMNSILKMKLVLHLVYILKTAHFIKYPLNGHCMKVEFLNE